MQGRNRGTDVEKGRADVGGRSGGGAGREIRIGMYVNTPRGVKQWGPAA